MTYRVTFRPGAQADLRGLYGYVAQNSGLERAGDYLDRIEAACMRLSDYPERGTNRSDLVPGLRTIGFERRVSIAFRVFGQDVEILAVLFGGRELTTTLAER